MEEHLPAGGSVNTVVRVGDTVRRKCGPWTPTIHRLLSHARGKGISWVPEPRGLDELSREVLSFIPGDVPHDMPTWVWSELVLTDVARALRQWHDATADFDDGGCVWNFTSPGPKEVVCHNDFAPYNCVFRNGRFVGAIDFDLCAPGTRLWDLAYTAYRFVPLMPSSDADPSTHAGECSPFPQGIMVARLDSFLAAYGSAGPPLRYERAAVIKSAVDRLEAIASWTADYVRINGVAALESHPDRYRAHSRWLDSWREAV